MCAQATRLSELKIKAAKPKGKDYVLVDAAGIDPREQRDTQEQMRRAITEHTSENVATAWFELKKDPAGFQPFFDASVQLDSTPSIQRWVGASSGREKT